MSYLDLLPKDIYHIIFDFLDPYDVLNLCIGGNIESLQAIKMAQQLLTSRMEYCCVCYKFGLDRVPTYDPSEYLCDDCSHVCVHCNKQTYECEFDDEDGKKIKKYKDDNYDFGSKFPIPGKKMRVDDYNMVCGDCLDIEWEYSMNDEWWWLVCGNHSHRSNY